LPHDRNRLRSPLCAAQEFRPCPPRTRISAKLPKTGSSSTTSTEAARPWLPHPGPSPLRPDSRGQIPQTALANSKPAPISQECNREVNLQCVPAKQSLAPSARKTGRRHNRLTPINPK
jgi:hypothetical protein